MNTIITVYGEDIDLSKEEDCRTITYNVVAGEGNSSELYWNLTAALVVFEMIPTNKFGDKAVIGIANGRLSMQIDITGDLLIFKVPIMGTSLDMANFELGTYNVGEIIMPEHNRVQLAQMVDEFTHKEFQYYLNSMVNVKRGEIA